MCVFIISPVPITEPLTSELIDTPVFHNLAPRPIKYRVSVPIPILKRSTSFKTRKIIVKFGPVELIKAKSHELISFNRLDAGLLSH